MNGATRGGIRNSRSASVLKTATFLTSLGGVPQRWVAMMLPHPPCEGDFVQKEVSAAVLVVTTFVAVPVLLLGIAMAVTVQAATMVAIQAVVWVVSIKS